ncbi:MAG: carboxypeptidase regulatory-like domain-containing protein [Calditrichota bacterium]
MRVLLRFLCLAALGCQFALAQPDTLWTCRIPYTAPGPMINGATALADGGYVAVGVNNPDATNNGMNFFVSRVTPTGQVSWTRVYGSSAVNEIATSVVELPSGDLVIAGYNGVNSEYHTVVLMGISATGDSLWYRSILGDGLTKANDLVQLSNGNLAVVGYRLGSNGTNSDLWLLMCESDGDTLWTRIFGGNSTDIGAKILEGPNNTLIIGGHTRSLGIPGDYDMWLLRTDFLGNQISSTTFGTGQKEVCYGLAIDNSSIYLCGTTSLGQQVDGYVVRATATGDSVWAVPFSNGLNEEQFYGIAIRPEGSLICVGWSGSTTTNVAPWYQMVYPDGSDAGFHIYANLPISRFMGILTPQGGGFLTFGIITVSGHREGYLMRIPPTHGIRGVVRDQAHNDPISGVHVSVVGTSRFSVTDALGRYLVEVIPGTYDLIASRRCYSPDTVFTVQSYEDSTVEADFVLPVPKYIQNRTSINCVVRNHVVAAETLIVYNDGSGGLDFSVTLESLNPPSDWISVTPAYGVVPVGEEFSILIQFDTDTTDDGVYDYFGYLVVHANSCPDSVDRLPVLLTVLDVPDQPVRTAYEYALQPAYPNPFNPTTSLTFAVPHTAEVAITVFDVMGREVQTVAQGVYSAGEYTVAFDAAGLPSGLYLARMQTADFTATQKLLLMK